MTFGIVIYCFTFWVEPWREEFGAARGTIMLGITLLNVAMGVASPFAGRAVDRLPIKYLVCGGVACLSLGLALSAAATALWQILVLYATLIPIGVSLAGPLAAQALATRWFPDRQGFAIGLSTLGTSIGGFVLPPIATALLGAHGWRVAQFDLALATFVILLPAVWFIVRDPGPVLGTAAASPTPPSPHKHGTASHTFRQRNFWVIVASLLPIMIVTGSVQFNMAPHASDIGLDGQTTALAVSLMALVMIGGKLGFGYFADRTDHRFLMWAMIAMLAIAVMLFRNADGTTSYITAAIVYGIGVGGMLPLLGAMVARCFGASAFGSVMGLLGPFLMLGAIGPVITGWLRDVSGSYELAFSILLIGFLPSALAVYFLRQTAQQTPLEGSARAG